MTVAPTVFTSLALFVRREGPAAAEIEFIGGDGAGRALSDGAIGLQAHIGGASIDGLIEREGPTGDEARYRCCRW